MVSAVFKLLQTETENFLNLPVLEYSLAGLTTLPGLETLKLLIPLEEPVITFGIRWLLELGRMGFPFNVTEEDLGNWASKRGYTVGVS